MRIPADSDIRENLKKRTEKTDGLMPSVFSKVLSEDYANKIDYQRNCTEHEACGCERGLVIFAGFRSESGRNYTDCKAENAVKIYCQGPQSH